MDGAHEQSIRGDSGAYRELLVRLTVALRKIVRSRAQAAGLDSEDVVQEVLLALHLKRGTWAMGTPVAPWAQHSAQQNHRRPAPPRTPPRDSH